MIGAGEPSIPRVLYFIAVASMVGGSEAGSGCSRPFQPGDSVLPTSTGSFGHEGSKKVKADIRTVETGNGTIVPKNCGSSKLPKTPSIPFVLGRLADLAEALEIYFVVSRYVINPKSAHD